MKSAKRFYITVGLLMGLGMTDFASADVSNVITPSAIDNKVQVFLASELDVKKLSSMMGRVRVISRSVSTPVSDIRPLHRTDFAMGAFELIRMQTRYLIADLKAELKASSGNLQVLVSDALVNLEKAVEDAGVGDDDQADFAYGLSDEERGVVWNAELNKITNALVAFQDQLEQLLVVQGSEMAGHVNELAVILDLASRVPGFMQAELETKVRAIYQEILRLERVRKNREQEIELAEAHLAQVLEAAKIGEASYKALVDALSRLGGGAAEVNEIEFVNGNLSESGKAFGARMNQVLLPTLNFQLAEYVAEQREHLRALPDRHNVSFPSVKLILRLYQIQELRPRFGREVVGIRGQMVVTAEISYPDAQPSVEISSPFVFEFFQKTGLAPSTLAGITHFLDQKVSGVIHKLYFTTRNMGIAQTQMDLAKCLSLLQVRAATAGLASE